MLYPKCDLNIHSISSGHAFNTIDEIIEHSILNGYRMIGISDHGPDMEHAAHAGYFTMLYRLPRQFRNMMVLYGCEANILDTTGNIDIPDRLIAKMDYVMAGLYRRTSYNGGNIAEHTEAIVSAIHSGKVDIISHHISLNFLTNPENIVKAALEEHVILECNKFVLKEAVINHNNDVIRLLTDLFNMALEAGAHFFLGSDAHHISEIGISDDELIMMQEIYNISLLRMLNENISELENILQKRKQLRSSIHHEK